MLNGILTLTTRTTPRSRNRVVRSVALLAVLLMSCASIPAWAHIGPPYPIMQNRRIGSYSVDVWSNPDVGGGSFFVIINPPPGGSVPADTKVQIAVRPLSGRLPEATYGAWREKLRDRVEYKTIVPFDKEEMWRVRILLTSSMGSGETDTDVPVTPPLLGRWNLLLFAVPFAGVGWLWYKAVKTKRENRRRAEQKKARKAQKSAV